MNKIRICLECMLPATDESKERIPFGLQIDLGEAKQAVEYDKIAELTDREAIKGVIKTLGMEDILCPEDVRIITPEEYDEEYGADTSGESDV